jgi:hypothetical protein
MAELVLDLDSIGERYTENNFRQMVLTIEATPSLIGGLGEPEDRRDSGPVRETSFGSHGALYLVGEGGTALRLAQNWEWHLICSKWDLSKSVSSNAFRSGAI